MRKLLVLFLLVSTSAFAQPPVILKAEAIVKTNQLFDIAVTLRHPDTGWEHFANQWVVILDGETEIAKRTLHHPHVDEQPFKRYVRDVRIPIDAKLIEVFAQCNKGHKSKVYVLLDKSAD